MRPTSGVNGSRGGARPVCRCGFVPPDAFHPVAIRRAGVSGCGPI